MPIAKQQHIQTVEICACGGSSTVAPANSSGGGSAGIPAFRPGSTPADAFQYAPPFPDGANSPGKAQLQAVRALARQQPAAPKRQDPQPRGTPGLSDLSSVGRAINAQIENTLADMFMATPPEVTSGVGGAGHCCSSGARRSGRSNQQQQQRRQDRSGFLSPEVPTREPSTSGARSHLPSTDHGCSEGTLLPPELKQASGSPPGVPTHAPPAPPPPLTAMRTSSALEPLSVKSPMFMSRRQRAMVCELDEPGSAIAYPRAHRRASAGRRLLAAFLPCFVPPASARSPAPSLRTPGEQHTPSSQVGGPLPGPALAFSMDPLRQSLAELALSDPALRSRISTSLADEAVATATGGQAGLQPASNAAIAGAVPRQSPLYGDLLGLQGEEDEEAQANMASPVLPSRAASGGGTPAGLAHGGEGVEAGDEVAPAAVLAKRNLMDVLRSKEAGTGHQQQGQQHLGHVLHPRHLGQHARQQQAAQQSSDDAPAFTPKRPLLRDLSKPSYRSQDLHRVLSPLLAGMGSRAGPVPPAALRRSMSAPASPSPLPAAGGAQGKGSSMPSSPLLGTQLTKAAAVRAAASQRKLQEREAQLQAVMAKSPDRWLRAAAAQGLSLREAAGFTSPGKSARPHYHPSPTVDRQQAGQPPQRQHSDMAVAAMDTPGRSTFDCFAAGEAGVEPYSARLHSAERSLPRVGTAAVAAAPTAAGGSVLVAPLAVHDMAGVGSSAGGKVDLDLAAGSNEYMEMLRRLEQGLKVDRQQLEPFTHPAPPPLPEHLFAATAADARADATQRGRSADGAVTVRARQASNLSNAMWDARSLCILGSKPRGPLPRAVPPSTQDQPGGPTPHHNALYGRALTPTKSSPLAQQRMVSMEAALRAGQAQHAEHAQHGQQTGRRRQQPQQRGAAAAAGQAPVQHAQQQHARRGPQRGSSGGGGGSRQASSAGHAASAATASASISFGSAGCAASTGGNAGAASGGAAAGGREAGAGRLRRLEALLLQAEAEGQHFTLAQLHAAGFSSHDVQALKQSLGRHG
ncbi:hypothetical protein ABPG77_007146 [Micractinium sp. CCAP 211/92]